MTATTIANLQIVPSKFAEYILERTTEKSALVRSGIAVSDPTVSQIINGSPKGGNIITMPYYKPLTGEDEVFGEEELGIDNVDRCPADQAESMGRYRSFPCYGWNRSAGSYRKPCL